MLQYKVAYSSKTGNTEKLAIQIYDAIPNSKKDIQKISDITKEDDSVETYFIGFWTDRGSCSLEVIDYLASLHGKNIVLFGTCGMGKNCEYYKKIERKVRAFIPDDNQYLGIFICQGKMAMQVRQKYVQLLDEIQEQENMVRLKKMIKNFDEGLLHPNQEDFENLNKFVLSIVNRGF